MDNDLEKIEQSSALDPATAKQLAALESALSQEKDGRKEERFYFVVVIFALVDIGAISVTQSYLLTFPFLLEIGFLIWFAKKMGSEEAVLWLGRIEALITQIFKDKRE
jgi:hypothetical protein